MKITDQLLDAIIEGALVASTQALGLERLKNLFYEDEAPDDVRLQASLERIASRCEHRGYELKKVASGYRFQVKQDVMPWVSRLWEEKPQRYSRALLETMAIIAYRQPITRSEIEDIRGVAVSTSMVKTLQEREWVQVVGYRDVPGRPAMYATTREFLDYFQLENLEQLPSLAEIKDLADTNHQLELEDKVPEGGYDLTSQRSESESEAVLASAADDLAIAEAIVKQVEANVFNRVEDETDGVQGLGERDPELVAAENSVHETPSAHDDAADVAVADDAPEAVDEEQSAAAAHAETEIIDSPAVIAHAPSVFADEPAQQDEELDEEAALAAAIAEELAAAQAEENEAGANRHKTFSDLASRFTQKRETENLDE
ncbi:MAG: SMC-Scp complex subunit ScpB [Oceanospirillaceae bacterium]|nr:SMC-Scp complex subunit ScpB [Oceanospirillaceae bacterium]MCP5351211.1 SMC-Scp complex subunit ScpB [Oceanospirillaceae bacterium]